MYRPPYKKWYEASKKRESLWFGWMVVAWLLLGLLILGATLYRQLNKPLVIPIPEFDMRVQAYETEVIVEKPVKELIPVPQRVVDCMKNYPDTAEEIKLKFGSEWVEAIELYCRESSLDYTSVNPSSGACGLVQALPCEKMGCELNDLSCQLDWGHEYIQRRYGTVKDALKFHDLHNWY